MFLNYVKSEGIRVAEIRTREEIDRVLKGMMTKYGVQWFWDPTFIDPLADRKCDLMLASRDQVIRLLWDLAFEACEKENDSKGLRALRRVVVPHFRNKSKAATSKYALYTLIDLVIELSASERSRRRMDHLVTGVYKKPFT